MMSRISFWLCAFLFAAGFLVENTQSFLTVPAVQLRATSQLSTCHPGPASLRACSTKTRMCANDEEPLVLSAYDQLVLSVRALSTKEIKQELVTRGVSFNDCFEKEDLVARLVEARLQLAAEAVGEGEVQAEDEKEAGVESAVEVNAEEAQQNKKDSRIFDPEMMKNIMSKDKIQAILQDQELLQALRNPTVTFRFIRQHVSPLIFMQVMRMAQEVLKVQAAIEKVKNFMSKNS
ncbi:hypothetical protein GUITHDRAFT_160415 [Guillardia theta CCMP2712]|uniref:Uncharacterized protein n=2 Tax=Guillardia theta TaxID=55529 RepID=L1K3X1_GUITC|nr:hypothetical protein GUITHDRAFT_160415 [Guillardia theta CCMP2712]EKX55262.1 hypothetical protein GUITHDRAFT_160415 [Guillardia theta CCMP2712]|eukprot:XP_005842242.1 hypothetical protein GUITHDRAFT_160415 [Guillardia theta CCMP2712]